MNKIKAIDAKVKTSKLRVILADDSPLIRERIKDLLKDINNVEIVGEAANGLEALQLIWDIKPDLVILDIRMPEMNGIEVLKKIREKGIDMKICMVTNSTDKQYRDRCLAEGADYFFDKNPDIDKMLEVISSLANNKKGG
ncbi:MAG TPA: response regulator transcription factor [Bacteroidales bacterium]|nr:response regulator transcription factor [Bacteroidales bacterium]